MDQLAATFDNALASAHMDAVDLIRAIYIALTSVVLFASLLDSFHARFIPYGARATPAQTSARQPAETPSRSIAGRALDVVASWKVPHRYFTHFYIASVVASVFWAAQVTLRGGAFEAIATRVSPEHRDRSMAIPQIVMCWGLMLVQGGRRLYECFAFYKPSSSSMWFAHWLVGLAFYLLVSVSIWIEGSGTLLSHQITLDDVKVANAPSLRTFLCLPVFLMASGLQHDGHHYLSSLEKYTLPTHPMFCSIVCPHYTAECVIYLSLAALAAPPGEMINKTLFLALVFVAVNLGITAGTTKQWYAQKFGKGSVQERWKMIPFVY
ncbi:protein DFG10, partial [Aspergillus campestris IBT 28561]